MTELSDETTFLHAVSIAKSRGFDWRRIPPESRGDWARKVVKEAELNTIVRRD